MIYYFVNILDQFLPNTALLYIFSIVISSNKFSRRIYTPNCLTKSKGFMDFIRSGVCSPRARRRCAEEPCGGSIFMPKRRAEKCPRLERARDRSGILFCLRQKRYKRIARSGPKGWMRPFPNGNVI
jgi:hypothetical protein